MKYLDTSILVSMLTEETTSGRALSWADQQNQGTIAVSGWSLVELNSALARKVRMDRLPVGERDAILRHFEAHIRPTFTVLEIDNGSYRLAAKISEQHEWGIRAGDALHLAVASQNHMPLATFDRHLASGAAALGYAVELLA
jgi:predicted nucleic acid-binding protein